MPRQFLVFLGVGSSCALIDILATKLLLLAGTHYMLAVSAGFAASVSANYVLHTKLTYRAAFSRGKAVRFAALVLLNCLMTLVLVYLSKNFLGSVMTGKIISIPVITLNGFFLGKYWVFK